jgi:hypothetical protein
MHGILFEAAFMIPATIFVICAVAALFVLQRWRDKSAARLANLRKADEHLERHFRAAAEVAQDPDTPKLIKSLVTLLCRVIGRRDMARSVAAVIMDPDRGSLLAPEHQPISAAVLGRLQSDLRELSVRRPDLVEKLDEVLEDGLLAMALRWPETDAAVALFKSRQRGNASIARGIEEKSAQIVAAAPTDLRRQYLLAAAPEAAAA